MGALQTHGRALSGLPWAEGFRPLPGQFGWDIVYVKINKRKKWRFAA
jgi:hypothetical protein